MVQQKKYLIDEINPNRIAFNPENVRDETEEQIESDENFQRLKESVFAFGVLVPLVIKPLKKDNKDFLLIDGERRLRAALSTNQTLVPVHILSKSNKTEEMLYAFQIHMLRKEWTRTAQARALKSIVDQTRDEILTNKSKITEKELFDAVLEKTGYGENPLRDLFRVLKYVKYGDAILDEIDDSKSHVKFSHLVQMEASFVEQVKRMYPELVKHYGLKAIREKVIDKVRLWVIDKTREPMNKLLPLFMNAKTEEQKSFLKTLVVEFLDKKQKTPDEIYRSFELKYPVDKEDLIKMADQAEKKIEDLEAILNSFHAGQFGIYKALKDKLIDRIDSLVKVLSQTKSRLNKGRI
jgi:ParB/RepB/Spo0J family partition protein